MPTNACGWGGAGPRICATSSAEMSPTWSCGLPIAVDAVTPVASVCSYADPVTLQMPVTVFHFDASPSKPSENTLLPGVVTDFAALAGPTVPVADCGATM